MVSIAALLWGVGGFAVALGLYLLGRYVVAPYVVLSIKRSMSRDHKPQQTELWWQEGTLLYIAGVNDSGVEIISATENEGGKVTYETWKDSWTDWHTRLRVRMIYFTGERRSLQ